MRPITSHNNPHLNGPVGFWFLNDSLEQSVINFQLDQYVAQKFSAVVLHPRDGLNTPWQSETWFQALEYIINGCKKRGLDIWYFDDSPYPSGSSGGLLVRQYPELVGKSLSFIDIMTTPENGTVKISLQGEGRLLRAYAAKIADNGNCVSEFKDITRYSGLVGDRWFVQGERKNGYGPMFVDDANHPHWRAFVNHEIWTIDWPVDDIQKFRVIAVMVVDALDTRHGKYVDLLNPQTTKHFIELSYQSAFVRLGADRFKQFAASFLDEPRLSGPFPWTDSLPVEYASTYGEDLFEVLPHLAIQIDEHSRLIRYQYRRLLGQLWEERFIKPISRWCKEHKLKLTGHISPEEDPILQTINSPGLTRLARHMDWPGYDLVLQPFGSAESAKLIGPKLISSIAHQKASEHLVTEALGCCGEDLNLRKMQRMINWLAICGFDQFVLHGQFMSLDGHRKREAPPSIFYQSPFWRCFHKLSDYISQISGLNSSGKPVRPIAVFYPSAAFEAMVPAEIEGANKMAIDMAQLVGRLMSAGLDFDLVADHDFSEAKFLNKESDYAFRIGQAEYEMLVLPNIAAIDIDSFHTLSHFQSHGGKLLSLVGRIPVIGSDVIFETPAMDLSTLTDQLIRQYRSWLSCSLHRNLYVQTRQVDERLQRMIWNPDETALTITINNNVDIRPVIPNDVLSCKIQKSNEAELSIELAPNELLILSEQCTHSRNDVCLIEPIINHDAHWGETWELVPADPNVLVLSTWILDLSDKCVAVHLPARTGILPWGLDGQLVKMRCEFIVDQPCDHIELWWERSTFGGNYEIHVNHAWISETDTTFRRDVHEKVSNISRLLKPGINLIEVNVGPILSNQPVMLDPMRLVGEFKVIRTGENNCPADLRPDWYKKMLRDDYSLPKISFNSDRTIIKQPTDWTFLGYPHYSGAMSYFASLYVPCNEDHRVFLETPPSQQDAFSVIVNGSNAGLCCWRPSRLEITELLKKGTNKVEIQVYNTSINRIEGKACASGLIDCPTIIFSGSSPTHNKACKNKVKMFQINLK